MGEDHHYEAGGDTCINGELVASASSFKVGLTQLHWLSAEMVDIHMLSRRWAPSDMLITFHVMQSLEHTEADCGDPGAVAESNRIAVMYSPAARRRAAAEFVQATTGHEVRHLTDYEFRERLKDGVLLCRMANTAFKGGVQVCSLSIHSCV